MLHAEQREIYGLKFDVERFEEVDQSNVKLTVGGEERLLSREAAIHAIAERGFGDAKRFEASELHRFILLALKGGDNQAALIGLSALFKMRPDDQASFAYAQEFLSIPRGVALLEIAVQKVSHEVIPFGFMIAYGASDPKSRWAEVAPKIKKDLVRFKKFCAERLIDLYGEKELTSASKTIALAREVLGVEDPFVAKWNGVEVGLVNAFSIDRRGDIGRYYPLFDLMSEDPALSTALHPIVIDLVSKEVAFLLAQGKPDEALRILSYLDVAKRTPSTHEAVNSALLAMPVQKFLDLDDPRVEAMLRNFSRVDPQVADSYRKLLVAGFRYQLNSRSYARADGLLQRLREVNPDPHELNDQLRYEAALALFRDDKDASAERKLASIETGISVGEWLKLALAGRYFKVNWLILILVVPILCILLYRMLYRLLLAREAARLQASAKKVEEMKRLPEDDAPQRRFVDAKYRQSMNPKMQEYQQLLHTFHLSPAASFSDIKLAYRNLAKANHPDASSASESKASDDFIKIKTTYERILAIRKELGMPVE